MDHSRVSWWLYSVLLADVLCLAKQGQFAANIETGKFTLYGTYVACLYVSAAYPSYIEQQAYGLQCLSKEKGYLETNDGHES